MIARLNVGARESRSQAKPYLAVHGQAEVTNATPAAVKEPRESAFDAVVLIEFSPESTADYMMEKFKSVAFRRAVSALTIVALRTIWLIILNGICTNLGLVTVRIHVCPSDAVH